MFKYIAVICALFLTLAVPQLSAEETSKRLVFVTEDFPPFNYLENGQVSGATAAVVKLVCKEIQVTCEHHLLPWSRAQSRIKNGAAQGIYTIGRNPSRELWLHFSPPIISTEYGFFVHSENPVTIENAEDIRGYDVGVFGPSNTSRSLQAFRGDRLNIPDPELNPAESSFTILMTPGDETGFRMLPIGRVDAVFSNRIVGWTMIRRLGLDNIRYTGGQKSLDYYIGFSKEYADPKMVGEFFDAYRRLLERGDVAKVLQPYQLQPKPLP
ncbi:MAG: transporter substrate-binding domain-containing protein [Motiliproteus sp.]|nr:transporter substrate-binding domain-containing protein [Motiliproteus sp.]MCW9052846.1 transporter substrate-binding domain-containing protein [Motiliproteus sp.]